MLELSTARISHHRQTRPVLQRIDTDAAARLHFNLEPRTARTSSLPSSRSVDISSDLCSSPGVSCGAGEGLLRSSSHDIRLAQYTRTRHLRSSVSSPYSALSARNDTPMMTSSTTSSSSPYLFPPTPFSTTRASVSYMTDPSVDDEEETVDPEDAWNLVPYNIPWGSAYFGYKSGTLPGPLGSPCLFLRSPTPLKNQRTGQACEKCRERKAKCSGARPSCARCIARGHVCEYTAESKRPKSALRNSMSRPNLSQINKVKGHRRNKSTPTTRSTSGSPPSPLAFPPVFQRRDSSSSVFSSATSPSDSAQSVSTSRSSSPASPPPFESNGRHTAINIPTSIPIRSKSTYETYRRVDSSEFSLPRSTLGLYFPHEADDNLDAMNFSGDADIPHSSYPSHQLSLPPYSLHGATHGDLQSLHDYRFPSKLDAPHGGTRHNAMEIDTNVQPAPHELANDLLTPTNSVQIHAPNPLRCKDMLSEISQSFDNTLSGDAVTADGYTNAMLGNSFHTTSSESRAEPADFGFTYHYPSLPTNDNYSQPDSQPYLYNSNPTSVMGNSSATNFFDEDPNSFGNGSRTLPVHPKSYAGFSHAFVGAPTSLGSFELHGACEPPIGQDAEFPTHDFGSLFVGDGDSHTRSFDNQLQQN